MLILRLIRYIEGYYFVVASGGFDERFINLCTRSRIPIWDIARKNGALCFFCTANCVHALGAEAEKAGMTLELSEEIGMKAFMKRHKKRKGLIISLSVCILAAAFLSSFVWSVSVEGNDFYSDEEIFAEVESHGVKIGSMKSKIDTRLVSEAIVSEMDNISWAKVNIRGCFAIIEIKEVVSKPDIFDPSAPVNIVASDDGVIMRNEVEVGSPAVKSGIAVTKGDLLVGGVLTNSDMSERLVHSKAFITAKVRKEISENITPVLYSRSENKRHFSLFFFGLEIPKIKNGGEYFLRKTYLDNSGRLLPLGIFRYETNRYESDYTADEKTALLFAVHRFNEKAAQCLVSAENVLEKKIEIKDGKIRGTFVLEKEIGVEKEILTE